MFCQCNEEHANNQPLLKLKIVSSMNNECFLVTGRDEHEDLIFRH